LPHFVLSLQGEVLKGPAYAKAPAGRQGSKLKAENITHNAGVSHEEHGVDFSVWKEFKAAKGDS
jgi:hypothetical protein